MTFRDEFAEARKLVFETAARLYFVLKECPASLALYGLRKCIA